MIRFCENCGKEFKIRENRLKYNRGKYCSRTCFHSSRKAPNAVIATCLVCGSEFKTWPSRVNRGSGKYCSKECYRKVRGLRGSDNPWWKGGITPESTKARHTIEYKDWRKAIFARDNWTCQDCGKRGGELHVHHVFSFAVFPEHRTALWNGVILCSNCHSKNHPDINLNASSRRDYNH